MLELWALQVHREAVSPSPRHNVRTKFPAHNRGHRSAPQGGRSGRLVNQDRNLPPGRASRPGPQAPPSACRAGTHQLKPPMLKSGERRAKRSSAAPPTLERQLHCTASKRIEVTAGWLSRCCREEMRGWPVSPAGMQHRMPSLSASARCRQHVPPAQPYCEGAEVLPLSQQAACGGIPLAIAGSCS